MNNRQIWVIDIETLAGLFSYSGFNIDTQEVVQYVLHKDKFELEKLIIHLKSCKGHIGFNGLNFDYPILHFILNNYKRLINLNFIEEWRETVISEIYNKAQWIIEQQNKPNGEYVVIRDKDTFISQMDLFRIWHFNNHARSQSLKGLEIAMNLENVMDMPIHHSTKDITLSQIDEILEYNLLDVKATYEFYLKSLGKIELRKGLISKYNLPCINYPDSKIGEELILKLYSEATGLNPYDVKKMRTYRSKITLKDCIFDHIEFKSIEFNNLLNKFKFKVITETKGAIEESVIYHNCRFEFGSGGIHQCCKPGVYKSDNEHFIIDADVSGMYPSIAVTNNLFPQHLGLNFCKVYENILNQRLQAKKNGDTIMSDGFKLSANSIYGKSNDMYSFLYDPKYTMQTTINGQLMLAMLIESLCINIPTIEILQSNTDGISVKIPIYEYENYSIICKEWEKKTKLSLEFVEYKQMIIRDVNNYFSETIKGKIKYKGAFEINKDYHKDNSFRIIPLALQEYFINNIPIKEIILNHKNIYDFCGRQKFTSESYGEIHKLSYDKLNLPYNKIEKQQKNVRYFISNKGSTFIKQYKKGSQEFINKGYQVTIFNKYYESDNYNINYNYYLKECQKEINNIISNQYDLKI